MQQASIQAAKRQPANKTQQRPATNRALPFFCATTGSDAGQRRPEPAKPARPYETPMKPGPGGTKTHTSSSGEPRPSQAACEAHSQVVTAVAPVEISENYQNRRDTHRAGPPDPCEPAPRVAPCHMFALFEVTARCPIETSRSLDTRGVATAKPQLFPPYSTTICVVLSPRAAFAERRTPDTVRPAPPPGAPFFRPGRSIKKRAVGAGTVPNPIRHRQEATDHGAPSKFRGTVEALHHDKGNPTPPDPTPPVENF